MKLFTELRDNSGQPAIRAVRKLGELEQKVARYRNHVVFNLRCHDEAITPPSLRLKCPIRSKRAQDIVRKAEKEARDRREKVPGQAEDEAGDPGLFRPEPEGQEVDGCRRLQGLLASGWPEGGMVR